ncbi:MAG: dinB, partial [Acidimicrobiaceae bacterium]|nr:dinB [Acidimicrobiaceae bacterium]
MASAPERPPVRSDAERIAAELAWRARSSSEASTGGPVEVVHLDMDAFFASVEVLFDPTLAGRPLVVGGTGDRGVVASASYEARAYGVRAAMPTGQARRLCPDAVFVRGRYEEYSRISGELRSLLSQVTPLVEPVALDEAYLDVSGAHALLGTSEQIAWELRRRVIDELQLSCSVGVGRTKLVAKLASEAAKPKAGASSPSDPGSGGRQVVVVDPAEEERFLGAHRIRAVPGIGPRTAERLDRFGVATVADLRLVAKDSLVRLLG